MLKRVGSSDFSPILGSRGILYFGHQTVLERGFQVGEKVQVGADYSEEFGTIVGLDDRYPDKAQVELTHAKGGCTTCWIQSEHLSKL